MALSDNYKIVIPIVLGPLHHMNIDSQVIGLSLDKSILSKLTVRKLFERQGGFLPKLTSSKGK